MDKLGRVIKKERNNKYKKLRKLRKARDMASKNTNLKLRLTLVKNDLWYINIDHYFTSTLAKVIYDRRNSITRKMPTRTSVSEKGKSSEN